MSATDWTRLWDIFYAAVELPTDEREAYLDEVTAKEPELRSELDALLAALDDEAADHGISQGIEAMRRLDPTAMLGQCIGPYRLDEVVGEGGMGVVYAAEQMHPIRRRVALKLIRLGMDSREVIARFEAERQALALMNHPNIARVLDAGAHDDGRPYFVMEYVPGIPITEYCDRNRLKLRRRIALFIRICDAVQHAHEKGIIHRDLKPSNILVVDHGHRPEPIIIDFGVAKAVSQPLTARTLHTRIGQFVGTPSYISPEQAEMGALDLDKRADIYSLGVLLFELSVGSRPFDSRGIDSASPFDVIRILRESDPPRPSETLAAKGAGADEIAARRSVSVTRLRRRVREDLDWIILKALEQDRTRRYQTADDFGRDLRRYLDRQAVIAHSPGVGYRMKKFAARHRLRIAAGAMAALVFALAYFGFDKLVLEPRRQSIERQVVADQLARARQEGRSEALVESYGDQSIAVLPFVNMSDDAGNEYFSDGISEELLNLLVQIPDLRVISRSSAFAYRGKDINLARVAEELNVAHVLEGSVRKAGRHVRITAQLIDARSETQLWSQTYDRQLDDIFAIQDEIAAAVVEQLKVTLLGDTPRAREVDPEAYALYLQARHLRRQGSAAGFEQAIDLYQRAVAIEPDYPDAWVGLARNYINQAGIGLLAFGEGYALARQAADKALATDPDHAPAHAVLGWIARVYDNDLAAAAGHYQKALNLDPANTGIINNAAALMNTLGRVDEAIALNEYTVARDPANPVGYFSLAIYYYYAGRWDDAVSTFETTLRLSPGYIGAQYFIGATLLFKDDASNALAAMQRESFEIYRLIGLALAHHALGDAQSSDAILGTLIENHGQDAAYNIAYVLAYRNEVEQAFEWLAKAVEYGDPGLNGIAVEPLFGNLHANPGWAAFLEGLGNAPEQLGAIEFEATPPGNSRH